MIFPALFAIIVGVGMIGQWSIAYFNYPIPELATEPIRIRFHIAAEIITALALILAGFSLLKKQPWRLIAFPISMGMVFYTIIVSPGYFAQKGEWAWVGLFAIILLLALVNLNIVFKQQSSIG